MINNPNGPQGGGTAEVVKSLLKSLLKKKIMAFLLPVLPYIVLGVIIIVAVVVIFSSFNNMFSIFTGTDPLVSETEKGDKKDLNDKDRLPGYENADEFMSTYDEAGSGIDKVRECESSLSLLQWLNEKLSGNFQTLCSMVNHLNKKAKSLEDKYNEANGNTSEATREYLDRGLAVATILYSYVFRDKDSETSATEGDSAMVSSGDPLTIINYMIEHEENVRINRSDINDILEHMVVPLHYIKYTYGVVKSEDVIDPVTEEVLYTNKWYGCIVSTPYIYEFDYDLYKLFLRDRRDDIVGYNKGINRTNHTMAVKGYIGAKNYDRTLRETTSFCSGGEPTLGEHEYLISTNSADAVTIKYAQSKIKPIIDNNLNDYRAFLEPVADYNTLEADALGFTYGGKDYEINYRAGFIYEKFSYFYRENSTLHLNKRIEYLIDVIFGNSVTLNETLNFPYKSMERNKFAGAVVVGDEAAPLGGYEYHCSSPWGYRTHPISGNWKLHNGLDMSAPFYTPIYAWKDGVVTVNAFEAGGCGYYLNIAHKATDGRIVTSQYCHMVQAGFPKIGDEVKAGEQIGLVGSTGGSTGPHLHFAIWIDGASTDPCPYMTVGRTCGEATGQCNVLHYS